MCDDICICISIGCPTKVNPSGGDGQARICPRCHNGSVFQAESSTWLEICFVSLFPLRSKDVWACNICSWQAELGTFQPIVASMFPPPIATGGGGMQMQPGYPTAIMTPYNPVPQPPPPPPPVATESTTIPPPVNK